MDQDQDEELVHKIPKLKAMTANFVEKGWKFVEWRQRQQPSETLFHN